MINELVLGERRRFLHIRESLGSEYTRAGVYLPYESFFFWQEEIILAYETFL